MKKLVHLFTFIVIISCSKEKPNSIELLPSTQEISLKTAPSNLYKADLQWAFNSEKEELPIRYGSLKKLKQTKKYILNN